MKPLNVQGRLVPHMRHSGTYAEKFNQHVLDWEGCTRCPLHTDRKHVVLSRGKIPADVCFIGEAPGETEDTLGVPFKGDAGDILNKIISEVTTELGEFRFAVSNILGCIPYNTKPDATNKVRPPTKQEAVACRPRLLEFINLVRPKLIVCLGDAASRLLPPEESIVWKHTRLHLIHPAAILRQPPKQASVSYKRCVLSLTAAIRNL